MYQLYAMPLYIRPLFPHAIRVATVITWPIRDARAPLPPVLANGAHARIGLVGRDLGRRPRTIRRRALKRRSHRGSLARAGCRCARVAPVVAAAGGAGHRPRRHRREIITAGSGPPQVVGGPAETVRDPAEVVRDPPREADLLKPRLPPPSRRQYQRVGCRPLLTQPPIRSLLLVDHTHQPVQRAL